MINDLRLLKFEISLKNNQCFKTNILTLITPEQERGAGQGRAMSGGVLYHFVTCKAL